MDNSLVTFYSVSPYLFLYNHISFVKVAYTVLFEHLEYVGIFVNCVQGLRDQILGTIPQIILSAL